MVARIRTLLYNDKGLLQGDICRECLKAGSEGIKERIRKQAVILMTQQPSSSFQQVSDLKLALELLENSKENVQFPTRYQWLLKKLEIFLLGSQELEAAELEVFSGDWKHSPKRSRLEKIFQQDEKSW
jgi:hypothetical protein